MNDIAKLGDSILSHLHRLKRPVVNLLNSPLNHNSIKSYEQEFPFKFPHCLRNLYSWKNGTEVRKGSALDDLHLFPGFYFLSMKDALAYYQNFLGDARWNSNWFPVFANGGGDFYCVHCEPTNLEKCTVLGFLLGEPETEIEFLSIHSLFETINEAFEERVYFVDNRGYLEANSIFEIEIAQKRNPGVDYWDK